MPEAPPATSPAAFGPRLEPLPCGARIAGPPVAVGPAGTAAVSATPVRYSRALAPTIPTAPLYALVPPPPPDPLPASTGTPDVPEATTPPDGSLRASIQWPLPEPPPDPPELLPAPPLDPVGKPPPALLPDGPPNPPLPLPLPDPAPYPPPCAPDPAPPPDGPPNPPLPLPLPDPAPYPPPAAPDPVPPLDGPPNPPLPLPLPDPAPYPPPGAPDPVPPPDGLPNPPLPLPPPDPAPYPPPGAPDPVPPPEPMLPDGPVNQPVPPAVPGPPPEALPPEPPVPAPSVPLFVPSAATINCRSFSGSFRSLSVCSAFIPNVRAASCAATVDFATAESAGTKQTSFTCTKGSPSRAAFNCSANCVGFVLEPVGKPRTKRARLACVILGEKWMLAIPAAESMRAKLFSAAAESRGVPSSSSRSPEAASNKPVWSSEPIAARNSLHAVSYCLAVRGCPKSYIRANFSKMFRLRTNARAAVARTLSLVFGAIV
jgi:hypothetical protein